MVNKNKENKKRFFYPDEFEKMLDYCNKNQCFTAKVMINTGSRINEARHIRKNNLNTERKSIVLEQTKVRARLGERIPEPRTIAVSSQFFRYIKENLNTHRILSTNAFNIGLKESAMVAGINKPEQFSSHHLRKTFGTWMLALGVDGFKLAQHLGHTPNELARDYATNDVFSHKDKQIMRSILGNLPDRFFPERRY
jgi:integrase|tara:strand:+ start:1822 stop:2409 length:588 start_codon:yes stop_codon:yes gene_type:complete